METFQIAIRVQSLDEWYLESFTDTPDSPHSFLSCTFDPKTRNLGSIFHSEIDALEQFLDGFLAGKTRHLEKTRLVSYQMFQDAKTYALLPILLCEIFAIPQICKYPIVKRRTRELLSPNTIKNGQRINLENLNLVHSLTISPQAILKNETHDKGHAMKSNVVYVDFERSLLYTYEGILQSRHTLSPLPL